MSRLFKIMIMLVIAASIFAGCISNTESTNVKTSGLYPEFYVKQDSNGQIKAEAQILVGGPLGTSLKMVGGEGLYCNGTQLFRDHSLLIGTWYTANVTNETSYVFRFQRTDEVIDTVLDGLPNKPEMGDLSPVDEGDSFIVTWNSSSVSGSIIYISLSTSKNNSDYSTTIGSLNDNGNYDVSSELQSMLINVLPGSYDIKVEVIRKKYHPINPVYQDGIGVTQSSDSKTVTYSVL